MTISDVGHNFRAIYDATHHEPSPKGTVGKLPAVELYSHLCPRQIPFIDGDLNFRVRTKGWSQDDYTPFALAGGVQCALNNTHTLFHQYQKHLLTHDLPKMKQYVRKISNAGRNIPIDESEYYSVRTDIQNFYIHTHHFLKSIHSDPNVRMRQIFDRHFCSNCFDHMELLEQMAALISLQGETGHTLPLKALIDASFGRTVEDGSLHDFVKILKDKNVSFAALHNGLKAVVDYAQKSKVTADDLEGNIIPSLDKLEYALYDIDAALFSFINPVHIDWRNTLHEGSELVSVQYKNNASEQSSIRYRFILGAQIGKKQQGLDHNIYFEIKECYETTRVFSNESQHELKYEPLIQFNNSLEKTNEDIKRNRVILISLNEAIPGIRNCKSELCFGMELSSIQFIDNQGRFALVEKLQENNEALIHVIPQWIKWAIKEVENAPVSLDPLGSPQKFLFNSEGILTAVKLLRPTPSFSFNVWEQFVYEIVKGDKNNFKSIMTKSELDSLEEAKFIRNSVISSFEEGQFNPQEQCKKQTFQDKNVLKLALDLRAEMNKLMENCCRSLESKGISSPSKDEIKNLLLKNYVESGGVSLLWPTLQEDVIKLYLEKNIAKS